METKTPLIDLAPKMFTTITQAQEVLAEWILPDSDMTDKEVLTELLGILDSQELVGRMSEVTHPPVKKFWADSPNVEYTVFDESKGIMEIQFKNGATYRYLDFTKECWDRLVSAPSISNFIIFHHKTLKWISLKMQ